MDANVSKLLIKQQNVHIVSSADSVASDLAVQTFYQSAVHSALRFNSVCRGDLYLHTHPASMALAAMAMASVLS